MQHPQLKYNTALATCVQIFNAAFSCLVTAHWIQLTSITAALLDIVLALRRGNLDQNGANGSHDSLRTLLISFHCIPFPLIFG